jgi:hypothetical protein
MKLRLQNFTVVMPTENTCIEHNNENEKVCKGMTINTSRESCTKWYKVCPSITSEFRTTAIFKGSVKETTNSNKTYRHVHDLSMYKTSFV